MPFAVSAQEDTPEWVRRLPVVTGTAAAIVAGLILLAWVLQVADRWWLASLPLMKANTALACLAAGIALTVRRPGQIRLLACVPIVVGSTALLQWIGGFSLGIDQVMAEDTSTTMHPGRPSPQVAGALLLFGFARLRVEAAAGRVDRLLTAVFAAVVLILEVGFLFQAPELTSVTEARGMTAGSALCLLLLLIGLLATQADRPPLRYLLDDGLTGTLTRRLLPAVILLPPALGLVRYLGQTRGWYGLNLGVALFTGAMVISLAIVVSITAAAVHRVETERRRVTEQLREAEQRARWLADRDPLTAVWNRRWFEVELTLHLESPRRASGALLIVDIDRFKAVNDTAGHHAGDAVLCAVAGALAARLPAGGSLSRIGGDEFAVLLTQDGRDEAEAVARALVAAVAALGGPDRGPLTPTVSVGVAAFADLPGPDPAPKTALRCADKALYAAKDRGRDGYAVFGGEAQVEAPATP